jgi:hypothetical protein
MNRSVSSATLSNSQHSGKREFCQFIEYVNQRNVILPIEFKTHITSLISRWRRRNKTIDDYFLIKNDNNNIQTLFNKYNIHDERMKELWEQYINTTLSYRIQRVSVEYPKYYFI